MKAAILIMSDPANGTEEALGRVFNGLAAALDFAQRDVPVGIYFQGAGTRWPALLSSLSHPANALFTAVQTHVVGASCGCADVFGARASVEACGVPLMTDNQVPGTSGLASVAKLVMDGHTVLTF